MSLVVQRPLMSGQARAGGTLLLSHIASVAGHCSIAQLDLPTTTQHSQSILYSTSAHDSHVTAAPAMPGAACCLQHYHRSLAVVALVCITRHAAAQESMTPSQMLSRFSWDGRLVGIIRTLVLRNTGEATSQRELISLPNGAVVAGEPGASGALDFRQLMDGSGQVLRVAEGELPCPGCCHST